MQWTRSRLAHEVITTCVPNNQNHPSFLHQFQALRLTNPWHSFRNIHVNSDLSNKTYPPEFDNFRLPLNPLLAEVISSRPGLYRSIYAGDDPQILADTQSNPNSSFCTSTSPDSPIANQFPWTGCSSPFIDYLRASFNRSQLLAVEASLYKTIPQAPSNRPASHFTLIQGPPGTGKTRTLRMLLNVLQNQQFDAYYEQIRSFVTRVILGNK